MAQQTMYPAIANSPGTELSAAITSAVTSIAVVDATKLPTAPNVFTIGSDESSETILYTGKSGNTLTGCTRGFDGTTSKAWAIGSKVARYYTAYDHEAFRKNLTDLSGVTNESTTDIVLSAGQQILNATKNARLQGLKIQGRTLIDLLGGAGSGESLTGIATSGAVTLSSTQKRSGNTSFKFSPSAGAAYITKDFTSPLDTSKYYVMAGWVFIESYVDGSINLSLRDVGTMTARYNVSTNISLVGQWQLVYAKIPINHILVGTGFKLVAGSTGSGTNVIYFDDIRLYAVSATDYAAIGTTITGEAIDRLLPYVPPGINGVDGLWVRRYGKNQLPGTLDLLHANGKMNGPYDYTLVATVAGQLSDIYVPVVPGKTYTISAELIGADAVLDYRFFDASGGTVGAFGRWLTSTGSRTFTVPDGAYRVRFIPNNLSPGTFTFRNWQLELGSTATPFQPREDSLLAFSGVELHANPNDGSEPDILREVNGRYEVTRLWRKMALDGSLPWAFDVSLTGFKVVKLAKLAATVPMSANNSAMIKYDGKPMSAYTGSASGADGYRQNGGDTSLFITIASADSGWGDSYTPSQAEIQAYFNGWRMFTDGQPAATNVYSGTGTKAWAKKNDAGGIVDASGVFIVPLTSNDSLTGRYQLLYRLAAVTMETVQEDGSLSLLEGDNFIEVGSGYVSRERITPLLWNSYYESNISVVGMESAKLKYKVFSIMSVFESSRQFLKWRRISYGLVDTLYGERFNIAQADYDPSQPYSVSYIKLDKSPVPSVTGTYAATEKAQLHDLTDGLTEALARVSVVEAKKAEKDAPAWIYPTLLNGWVLFDSTPENAVAYRRNGIVLELKGVIKSGVKGQAAFSLIKECIPKSTYHGTTVSNSDDSSTSLAASLAVERTGLVKPSAIFGGNGTVYINASVPLD